jgi:hypothetical protein
VWYNKYTKTTGGVFMHTEKQIKRVLVLLLITVVIFISTMIITVVVYASNNTDIDITESSPSEEIKWIKEVTPHYNVTSEERELLARIVTCESASCSLECQKDVCSVIFNRLESGKWKKDMNGDGQITLYDIIYYPNAFSPTIDGSLDRCIKPCKSAYEAVDYVIENGATVPTYVRYFRDSYDFSWEGYKNYKTIDNVYFGYFENWERGAW